MAELIVLADFALHKHGTLPREWQEEILNRLSAAYSGRRSMWA